MLLYESAQNEFALIWQITQSAKMEKKEEKVENILTVKNLSIEFANDANTITAVNGIDFEIRKGETIGIVGESGSGKSVTSLAIMRLINQPPGKISSGEIVFNSRQFGLVDLLQISEASDA